MVTAIILAGGFGERTLGLTGGMPKGLIKNQAGQTILGSLLDDLLSCEEVKEIRLVSNSFFYSQFQTFIKENYTGKAKEITVLDDGKKEAVERLGALGDLLFAMRGNEEELLVLPSDTAYRQSFSLKEFLRFSQEPGRKDDFVTIVYDTHDTEKIKNNLGCVVLDEKKRFIQFEEKPQEPKSTLTILAAYLYRPNQIPLISEFKANGGNLNSPSNIIPFLMEKGIKISGFPVSENVVDANDPTEIEKVKSY